MTEEEYRRNAVKVIVGEEVVCPDDHWNDDIDTRPDSAWTSQYHRAADHVEFCGRPSIQDKELWVQAYIEAEDQVIDLWRGGHKRARAILDLYYEIAYTCDDCGLWAHVEHVSPKDGFSEEARGGALFDVSDCDIKNLHRIHGRRISADEAWAREQVVYVDQKVRGEDLRKKRVRDYTKYNAQRRAKYAADKEAKREATTQER